MYKNIHFWEGFPFFKLYFCLQQSNMRNTLLLIFVHGGNFNLAMDVFHMSFIELNGQYSPNRVTIVQKYSELDHSFT